MAEYERDRAESSKGRSFVINQRDQNATDFDREVFKLTQSGYDPVDAISIASARQSRKELAEEGKTFTGQTLYITDNEIKGITEYSESRTQNSLPSERDILQGFQAEAAKQNRTISDYIVSRDSEGRIIEASARFGFNDTAAKTYIPNIEAQEAARLANIRSGYSMFKDTMVFIPEKRGGDADFPTLTPVRGNPFAAEGFTERGKVTVVTPPPVITTREIQLTRAPIKDDPVEGFKAPFQNIVKSLGFTIRDITGGRQVPRTVYESDTGRIVEEVGKPDFKPELEADFIGSAIESVQKGNVDAFKDLGKDIVANPKYFAGSAVASAALWITPAAGTKIGRLAGIGLTSRRTKSIFEPVMEATKRTEKPIKIDIEKGIVNIGTESDTTRFGIGVIKPGGKVGFFQREVPKLLKESDILVPKKQVTAFTREAVEIGKRGEEQLIDVGKLPKNLPDTAPIARKGEEIFEKVEVIPGRDPVFLKTPKSEIPVAVEQEFSTKQLRNLFGSPEGVKRFLGTGDDFKPFTKGATREFRPGKPFDFPKEQITKETAKQLSATTSDLSKIGSAMPFAGLGPSTRAASQERSLGFRGLTGQERRGKSEFEVEFTTVRFPKTDSVAKQFLKQFSEPTTRAGQRGITTERNLLKSESKLLDDFTKRAAQITGSITGKRSSSDTLSLPRLSESTASLFKVDTGALQRSLTGTRSVSSTRTTTLRTTKIPEITLPTPPSFRFGKSKSGTERKSKKKKGATKRTVRTTDPLAAVLGGKVGREIQKFADAFG